MENLLELRNEIDAIDKEIVGLFQKRMKISSEVAEYKISTGKKCLTAPGRKKSGR